MTSDGYGPPDEESDAWFQHRVVSLGYPKLHRPKDLPGQMPLTGEKNRTHMEPVTTSALRYVRCWCGVTHR